MLKNFLLKKINSDSKYATEKIVIEFKFKIENVKAQNYFKIVKYFQDQAKSFIQQASETHKICLNFLKKLIYYVRFCLITSVLKNSYTIVSL